MVRGRISERIAGTSGEERWARSLDPEGFQPRGELRSRNATRRTAALGDIGSPKEIENEE